MNRLGHIAALWALAVAGACAPDRTWDTGSSRAAVVSGATSPDELGFAIDALQRNAVLAQVIVVNGKTYQGCCGTLVGDRLVVSASHCVVQNLTQWQQGAPPSLFPPENLTYVVGDDIRSPVCQLQAASVHLHPQATPGGMGVEHDVSITVLTDSVLDSCPRAMPVLMNRDPVDDLVGESVLQGGFGSVDNSYNFSPVRYWSLPKLSAVGDQIIAAANDQHGYPSYGDSGSGLLYRFADGSLRTLGVLSSGAGDMNQFIRLDAQGDFLDQVATPELACGAAGAGVCRDQVLITCDANGFAQTDCAATGTACAADDAGGARCECACDTTQRCEEGCACDADCPCACDVSAQCDQGCTCDPQCPLDDATGDGGCRLAAGRATPRGAAGGIVLAVLALAVARGASRRRRAARRS
jgi:hypothetical protein